MGFAHGGVGRFESRYNSESEGDTGCVVPPEEFIDAIVPECQQIGRV